MGNYKVFITDAALKDMEAIYRYITEAFHAPDTAADQYDRIADAALSLALFPERNRLVDFEPERTAAVGGQLLRILYGARRTGHCDECALQRLRYRGEIA